MTQTLTARRAAVRLAAAGCLAAAVLLVPGALSKSAWAAPAPAGSAILTPAGLAADLTTGLEIKRVPRNLDPSLSQASDDKPIIARNGCNLGHAGVRSRPCLYGDRRSHTYVALFGDSHAAAWFPALDLISRERHWRLAVFTKDGCPPAEVDIAAWFRRGGPYTECARWRNNAMAQIAALHPALVVLTTATYLEEPEARPERGVPRKYGSSWLNGWAAVLTFLHRVARATAFIADVPTIQQWVPSCVSRHMSNVRACTTQRGAADLVPGVAKKEMKIARHIGATTIDPTPWFCTPRRCPVIVGHVLLYRDNAHMTPEWSRFIAPLVAAVIAPLVQTSAP